MNNHTNHTRNNLFSEAILLAGIPALAYYFNYIYEQSYCDYFGIPREFISISSDLLLSNFYHISLYLLIVYFAYFITILIFTKSFPALKRIFRVYHWPLFASYLSVMALKNPVFLVCSVVGLLLSEHLFFNKKEQEYKLKNNDFPELIFANLDRNALIPLFSIILFIIFGSQIAGAFGRNQASMQNRFYIFKAKDFTSELAVIRKYGNRLILVSYDKETKNIPSSYYIYDLDKIQPMDVFTAEVIGPLHLEKKALTDNSLWWKRLLQMR